MCRKSGFLQRQRVQRRTVLNVCPSLGYAGSAVPPRTGWKAAACCCGMTGMQTSITEQKRTEAFLRRLALITEQATEFIGFADTELRGGVP